MGYDQRRGLPRAMPTSEFRPNCLAYAGSLRDATCPGSPRPGWRAPPCGGRVPCPSGPRLLQSGGPALRRPGVRGPSASPWLAHWVEHKTRNLGVAGSTPAPDRLTSDSRPTESRASCRPARPSPRPRPRGRRQRRAPMRFAPRRIPPGPRGRSPRPRRPRGSPEPGRRPQPRVQGPCAWAQAAVRVIVVARRPAILFRPPRRIASRPRCWSSV